MVGFLKSTVIYNNETLFQSNVFKVCILFLKHIPVSKRGRNTRFASKSFVDIENKIVGGIYD